MTYTPDGFGAAGSMVVLAANGHMIIQCGGSLTILASGSDLTTTLPPFSQWGQPRAMYAMPGTVFDGLGAFFIRSSHHCFTAASIHIGSGSGRFITVGMQVKPLVPGLPSLSLPSAPNTSTEASFAMCGGAALRASLICSSCDMAFTSFPGFPCFSPAVTRVAKPRHKTTTKAMRMIDLIMIVLRCLDARAPLTSEKIACPLFLSLSHLKPDIERSHVAWWLLGELKEQLLATVSENTVLCIPQRTVPLGSIRSLSIDLIREGFVEVQLRRKLIPPSGLRIRTDLEVDVDGSARVPTGIDREKLGRPIGVRDLIAAQEFLPSCVKGPIPNVRIDAECIAVPDIHHGACERRAGVAADLMDMKRELEWNAFFHRAVRGIRSDV